MGTELQLELQEQTYRIHNKITEKYRSMITRLSQELQLGQKLGIVFGVRIVMALVLTRFQFLQMDQD